MLKTFIALIILSFNVMASEPDQILIATKAHFHAINFSDLKTVEMKAINYHPNFQPRGENTYRGYKLTDILKLNKITGDQSVVIVGKTGQFSLELKAKELLSEDVIVATHMNGIRITDKESGNQIIYGPKSIAKYPHLKMRQNWCWWVRALVLDNDYKKMIHEIQGKEVLLSAPLPFPVPYGISSFGDNAPPELFRRGKLLNTSNVKIFLIKQINGNSVEVPVKNGISYFLSESSRAKLGGTSLYEVKVEGDKVTTFLSNNFYVQSLEVIK